MKSIMNVKAASCCFFPQPDPQARSSSASAPSAEVSITRCCFWYRFLLLFLYFFFIIFSFKNHNRRVNTFLTVSAKEVTFAVDFFFVICIRLNRWSHMCLYQSGDMYQAFNPFIFYSQGYQDADNLHYASVRTNKANRSERQRDDSCVYSSVRPQKWTVSFVLKK